MGTATAPKRRAQLLVVAVGLVFLVPGPIYVITGWSGGFGGQGHPALVLALAAGIAAIHVRHGLAALRGSRPAGWVWTLAALLALVYVPMPDWSWNWASTQWFVVASALMLLRPPLLATAFAALPVLGTSAAIWGPAASLGDGLSGGLYWSSGLVLGGVALYGTVRLLRVLDELSAARAELAEAAVGQERLRVSRDLHDLLGQSLSAVSLKGDLALALLPRDPAAARGEIEGLTEVAREALHGVRSITHDEHVVSLSAEVDGALALLAAAGITGRAEVDVPAPEPATERLLAWGVREGVTNVLRHADATACSIVAGRQEGVVRLEMVNDGAHRRVSAGTGLAGLDARARALGGEAVAESDGERFRLTLTVPEPGVSAAGAEPDGARAGAQ